MALGELASRVVRRSVVENWARGYRGLRPEDLLNDLLEDRDGSLDAFRNAVAGRRGTVPYLGKTDKHLVWCVPSTDIQEIHDSGASKEELLQKLGMTPVDEDAVEILYPASAASLFYKPCAVHAGASALFSPAPVDSEFGLTRGGLREAVHPPLPVVSALTDGARMRLWRT